MAEFLVIFSLVAAGSLVGLSAELLLRLIARKTHSATIAMSPSRSASAAATPEVDPVLAFGFTVAVYGAIALALVSACPGPLALDRTGLGFAFLCVGGLINAISCNTGATRPLPNLDCEENAPAQRSPISLPLSIALTLMLNLTVAVLSCGQGLIEVVPPMKSAAGAYALELDPIIVVAERHNETEDHPIDSL